MMEIVLEFINTYGTTILYALLTAIAGFIGVALKNVYTKYVNDKTKQAVCRTVVKAVEQLYRELDGPAKLAEAQRAIVEMLAEKGITITELEMNMLIEATVSEFNASFGSMEIVESKVLEDGD
jgi:hypothetical protein